MELEVWWSAMRTGTFYGLIGLAILLGVRATNVTNFAVGGFVTIAAFVYARMTVDGSAVVLAILAALAIGALLNAAMELAILRPMERRATGEFPAVMTVVATLFVLQQLTAQIFGRFPLQGRPVIEGSDVVGSVFVVRHDAAAVLVTLLVFAGFSYWFAHGRYGRMLRAVGDNEHAARTLGLSVGKTRLAAALAAGALCALAGVGISAQAPVLFDSGLNFALFGFVAYAIGGAGSVWGPLLGGLVLGLTQTFSSRYLGGNVNDYILLALVLIVFTFRPRGLLTVEVRS
jgi:branched-chain amino acid transport system permease protein